MKKKKVNKRKAKIDKATDKRLGFWRNVVPYGHSINEQKLKEGFKKWFWPTVRVGLPIGIVAAGAVFVVLAVINQWMDVGSARYLLSAIVQSLAALLAIIFAGVAILWGLHSTLKCNTKVSDFEWCFEFQAFAWPVIKP